MGTQATHSCLNCDHQYAGKFCPECGQKGHTDRITLSSIAHEVPHSVFHLDKGFLYTFKQLLVRPGHSIREYVNGKRVKHYSPIAYLLIMCAASSLLAHFEELYYEKVYHKGIIIAYREVPIQVAYFFQHYPALMFCVMLPFISFWAWLFNRDAKYNYWETLVLNIYVVAQFNLFFIVYGSILLLNGRVSGNLTPMLAAFFLYLGFAYTQFYSFRRNNVWQVVKRILMYLLIVVTVLSVLTATGFMTQWWRIYK